MKRSRGSNSSLYTIAPPYDLAFRSGEVMTPAVPHSHDGAEVYFTLTDLPDVLLGDTVSAVSAGTLIIIPAFCVHQLYHEAGRKYDRYVLMINTGWLGDALCGTASDFSYLKSTDTPLFIHPESTKKRELLRRFRELLSFDDPSSPEALSVFF
ncbi:MAG: hypothetical protein K6A38_11010 [Lachnospiraceae bacterium]|nr:hypothetical protein [Lachnospiraceae bacterium]